jgi:hypothetical protein
MVSALVEEFLFLPFRAEDNEPGWRAAAVKLSRTVAQLSPSLWSGWRDSLQASPTSIGPLGTRPPSERFPAAGETNTERYDPRVPGLSSKYISHRCCLVDTDPCFSIFSPQVPLAPIDWILKGLHFNSIFWHIWIDLGLNKNRFCFRFFQKPPRF